MLIYFRYLEMFTQGALHCSLLNNLEKTVCRFLVHVEFDQSIDRIKFEYIVSNIKFIL